MLVAGVPLWSQVSGTTDATAPVAPIEDRMQIPPPVSATAYPTAYLAEERSNYLRAGLTFTTAYSDNVFVNASGNPMSDVSYSIFPNIALDQTTPRLHWVLSYAPGFTFYQRESSGDQANQNFSGNFRCRLSPHVTLILGDSLQKASSLLDQPGLAPAAVTGSAQGVGAAVIAPLADQLTNTGNAEITYQFSANAMIGASGSFSNLHYSNSAQVPGLADSSSQGGSAFYNQRLAKKHYLGASYQYQRILANLTGRQSETQTQAVMAFYTFYPQPSLSFSVSAGPQHSDISQSPLPSAKAWSPAVTASMGWQARRTSLAISYSRVVSGGGGLVGAFHANSANLSLRQQLSRNWSGQIVGAYSINKTVTPLSFLSSPGGHAISGGASIQRTLGQHLNAAAGYTRLHQSYGGIPAISTAPDTSREWLSVSYQFARPLGR
jgi:hypothetical protein